MRRMGIWLTVLALHSGLAMPCIPTQAPRAKKASKPEDKLLPSLSKQIHHQLLVLPFYSVFDSIAFTLDGSKVTLTGQVVRHTLKDHAEASVKSIEGVDAVINHIEVLPASPADDDLRRAVYRAVYEDSTLARYAVQPAPAIHIIVKNRSVALEGFVNSDSDKNLATARASGVAGALSVRNNLVVQPKGSTAE
ncbi:MAG: BON domain-containing protein [Candidatus Acidiferrum sp.]